MRLTMTALDTLLAKVSDAELETLFCESLLELAPGATLEHLVKASWYSGPEIRELLATRQERRQARVDEESRIQEAVA